MANNIVSRDVLVLGEVHWPLTLKDYSAKLDALVEAADHLVNHPVAGSCDGADSPLRTFNVLDVIRLAAALAAIKLPEAANGGE